LGSTAKFAAVGLELDAGRSLLEGVHMKQPFNHAANDSPRSGSSKRVTPVVWGVIVAALVAIAIWFAISL
jgi:hypothetical protein